MRNQRESLKKHDLDFSGSCFGIRIIKRQKGQSDLIELYTEDDENWHYTTQFAAFWLNDLIKVCQKTSESADTEVIFKV